MKKILLSAAMLAIAATGTFAQNTTTTQTTVNRQANSKRLEARKAMRATRTPEQMAKMKVERLDKVVSLTDAQKQRAEVVYLKEAKMQKDRMALRKETQTEINSILDKDQLQKLETVKKERMDKMRTRAAKRAVPAKSK